jgi:hydrogenase nickel incorporation protein HypA/HybF
MHELSLAQHLCRVVQEHVPTGRRVVAVVVEIGPMSGVVADALDFCFGLVARASGLPDARLDCRQLAAPSHCAGCGARGEVMDMWASCPDCGHAPLTIEGGREFRIKEIEVDDV